MGKMFVLAFAVFGFVLIQHSNCQRQEFPPHFEFFNSWEQNSNPPIRLNDQQAAWWYSLGHYRPRYDGEDYYPPPPYKYPVPYEYPPYGGVGTAGNRDCEEIPGPMRKRMEIREMTQGMRNQFASAVMALAEYCPDNCVPCNSNNCTSAYDLFVSMHQTLTSPGAHNGASFYPWHREYLWRFENALIANGSYPANLGVPYWDNILESGLPDAAHSVLWTSHFMGNENGLLGAPFADLSVPATCGGFVERNAGLASDSYLFQEADIEVLTSQSCFAHLTRSDAWTCPWGSGVSCNFEDRHGYPHVWVGGDMATYCSPSDPLFWIYHGYIDCLWEHHRIYSQETNLEKEYPQSSFGGPQAAWNAPMSPFSGLINAHGLSTHYTQYYYDCAARPSAKRCDNDAECNTPENLNPLWCDDGVCRSKIRERGVCSRAGDDLPHNACWCAPFRQGPRCENGVCKCDLGVVAVPAPAVPAGSISGPIPGK